MIVLPAQLVFFSFITIPTYFMVQFIPIVKFIIEFFNLTLQISRLMLSVGFLWIWEIALNTEFVDVLAIVLSVYISTKVLLDIFSYEIVFTFNSDNTEYEQQIDLN
uniref:Transmembrane domain-containing protein n=1 Tax=Caenorhabditis tropicalis TaxID=1561998 RepID=A0A1I7TES8_9PELO